MLDLLSVLILVIQRCDVTFCLLWWWMRVSNTIHIIFVEYLFLLQNSCYRLRSVASESYVFTGICLFTGGCEHEGVCRGWPPWAEDHTPWDRSPPNPQTEDHPPRIQATWEYGQCAVGTHLTGMHCCLISVSELKTCLLKRFTPIQKRIAWPGGKTYLGGSSPWRKLRDFTF